MYTHYDSFLWLLLFCCCHCIVAMCHKPVCLSETWCKVLQVRVNSWRRWSPSAHAKHQTRQTLISVSIESSTSLLCNLLRLSWVLTGSLIFPAKHSLLNMWSSSLHWCLSLRADKAHSANKEVEPAHLAKRFCSKPGTPGGPYGSNLAPGTVPLQEQKEKW
jgi:hypothetical protein